MKQVYHAPLRIVWATNLEAYKRDWFYWSTGHYPQEDLPAEFMKDSLPE
jgi:hypothetical protein